MFTVEVPSPLKGAAYQILFELTSPQNCTTPERQAEIKTEFARILVWAKTQPQDVLRAYKWASSAIENEIERSININKMHRDVHAAVGTIPRPPSGKEGGMTDAAPLIGEIAYLKNDCVRHPIIFTHDGWQFCRAPESINLGDIERDDVCRNPRRPIIPPMKNFRTECP